MHKNRKQILCLMAFLMACSLFCTNRFSEQTPTETARTISPKESAAPLQSPSGSLLAGYIETERPVLQMAAPSGLSFQQALEQRRQVLHTLQSHLGTPYVYGGAWPGGFDCSGIIYYIYNNLLGYPITRCADTQLLYDGISVTMDALQPGDLVFFRDPGSPWAASHAGIYVGDGQMIHASSSKGLSYASIHSPYFSSRYVGAKRIIQPDTSVINPDISGLNLR